MVLCHLRRPRGLDAPLLTKRYPRARSATRDETQHAELQQRRGSSATRVQRQSKSRGIIITVNTASPRVELLQPSSGRRYSGTRFSFASAQHFVRLSLSREAVGRQRSICGFVDIWKLQRWIQRCYFPREVAVGECAINTMFRTTFVLLCGEFIA